MLLEAGFHLAFLRAAGIPPALGRSISPPSRASLFLLQWEWFRIYFESGVVKIASGDPQWRNFTAMDEYYQNGPLPTWIGWYVQHLPHWFHAATVYATLALELGWCGCFFCRGAGGSPAFFIVTPWQIGVILTANYTFLNYLVLVLGFLLARRSFLRAHPARAVEGGFLQSAQAGDGASERHVTGSTLSAVSSTSQSFLLRRHCSSAGSSTRPPRR